MTQKRPPLPTRWEYHLFTSAAILLVAALQVMARRTDTSGHEITNPHLRAWLESSETEKKQTSWGAQLSLERSVLHGLTSAWLAWRAFQFERASQR